MTLRGQEEENSKYEEQKQGIEREKIKFNTKIRKSRMKAKWSKRREE